ncbi:retroviral-like aspartic protease family protein [Phenylobacterium sp.]|uniref:retroviral-like aspartic protease family protein n=1 Tax=Phenylobacterium sp. TaxID=1871053 RepID=UPI003568D2DE
MLPNRRQAATSLFAAAAAALPFSRAVAQIRMDGPALVEETPTQIDTGHDAFEHMLGPVTINGQGPFQFLIDTGANTSCVSKSLADRLALPTAEPARVHTIVGVRERPGVLIDRLQVGARNRKAVRAAVLPLNDNLDGVLGIDWLSGQRLELGFKAKNLAITRSREEVSKEGSAVVPARRRLGQLTIVDADLSGKRISAMIDSGSQMTMCNAPLREMVAAADRRRGRIDPYQRMRMETLVGEQFYGEMLFLPFMRLGGLHLGNIPVVYADMHVFDIWGLKDKPAVVLGMDLLTQFDTVSMDFGRSQVRFDISEPGLPPARPFRSA